MRFKAAANLTPPCANRSFKTGTREAKYFSASQFFQVKNSSAQRTTEPSFVRNLPASVEPSETPLYAQSQAA